MDALCWEGLGKKMEGEICIIGYEGTDTSVSVATQFDYM